MEKLRKRMREVQEERSTDISLSLDSFRGSPEHTRAQIRRAADILDRHGVLFVTDVLTDDGVLRVKRRLVEAHNDMFGHGMHDIVAERVEDIPEKAQTGVFGNKGFAYLYKQPLGREATPTALVGSLPEPVDHCPVYRRVNLATLLDNRAALDVMMGVCQSVTGSSRWMVSADSAKVSLNHKTGANPLTVPHVDVYDERVQRVQIILCAEESATKLFYAPGTNDPQVQQCVSELAGNPKFYKSGGFKRIEASVADTIRPFMVAPPPRSLAFWKPGVVHAEWTASDTPGADGLYTPHATRASKQGKRQLAVRMAVGMHVPTDLTETERMQLGLLAEDGVITSRYYTGSNRRVLLNKMHQASTRWSAPRVYPDAERRLVEAVCANVADAAVVAERFARLDPALQKMYGVVPVDKALFVSPLNQ